MVIWCAEFSVTPSLCKHKFEPDASMRELLDRHAQLRYLLHRHSNNQQLALIAVAISSYEPGVCLYYYTVAAMAAPYSCSSICT
jgi:hypothetical protein